MAVSPAERTIGQIRVRLEQIFAGKIDLSDVGEGQQESHFRTRALAALYLMSKADLAAEEAAKCVTDGGQDNGIDAVYFDQKVKKLHLVQSKFSENPNKGIAFGDYLKFREGVSNLVSLNFDPFNQKIKAFSNVIEQALGDIDTVTEMTLINTSEQDMSAEINADIQKFKQEQNKFSEEFLRVNWLDLANVTEIARQKARPEAINTSLLLNNFGKIHEPYTAVFGVVSATDIARLKREFGNRLLAENLRFFLEKSEVNDGMTQTIKETPGSFWYYNNGITAICNSVTKQPKGGPDTDSGVFDVEGISIINGAQTVGSIARAHENGHDISEVKVLLRIISLAGTPEEFSAEVTRANNTQNDLTPLDFASQDEQQERLRLELAQLGVVYSYRRGESTPKPEDGFDIRAATVALACSKDQLRLAVAAKRYISSLWDNIRKEPYTLLFNPQLSGAWLWSLVRLMRCVDSVLDDASNKMEGRDRLIPVHGNRFVLHCVFNSIDLSNIEDTSTFETKHDECAERTREALDILIEEIGKTFPDAYPGNIFKNQERQRELRDSIFGRLSREA
jgi:hypothetical protein